MLVLAALLAACGGSDSSADECSEVACDNLITKPINKNREFCGAKGASTGVSSSAEGWSWSTGASTCECEIQLNQTNWSNCSFTATK